MSSLTMVMPFSGRVGCLSRRTLLLNRKDAANGLLTNAEDEGSDGDDITMQNVMRRNEGLADDVVAFILFLGVVDES